MLNGCDDCFITQVLSRSTFGENCIGGNILDLILTSDPERILEIDYGPEVSFGIERVLNNINEGEILKKLKNLKESKSMSPDQIHPMVLKECAMEFAIPLTKLFRESIKQGKIPNSWRFANISPIFKKGHRTARANYRPISLTSVISKILERIIRDELLGHLMENRLVTRSQHGFVPSKSCLSNLLETLDSITSSLVEGNSVDGILLDFAKAFDLVPIAGWFKK